MKIAIYDEDKENIKSRFPNYALMKIAGYHKSKGNDVSWYHPFLTYDKVYVSKIFTYTKSKLLFPESAIKGGTGYDISGVLDEDIENSSPDYSMYSDCDFALGFITRGCIRNCSWCVVPKKEGMIKPYRKWQEIVRQDTKNLVLMDNNILASDFGLSQIDELANTDYRVDFNQGLDARLITREVAKLLADIKWMKYIRVSCDTEQMIETVGNAYNFLREAGYHKDVFCYTLVKEFDSAYKRLQQLKSIGVVPYAQQYRDIDNSIKKDKLLSEFCNWVNTRSWFMKLPFEDFLTARKNNYLIENIGGENK